MAKKEIKPIKMGIVHSKKSMYFDHAQRACDVINEKIIPALKELHLSLPTLDELAKWVQNGELFENAIANKISKKEGVNEVTNMMLRDMLHKEINTRVDNAISGRRFNGVSCNTNEIKIDIDAGVAVPNMETIEEKATYYLTTEEEITAYYRHKKALDALNEFFDGKACDLRSFFTVKNGRVYLRELADFSMFNT